MKMYGLKIKLLSHKTVISNMLKCICSIEFQIDNIKCIICLDYE